MIRINLVIVRIEAGEDRRARGAAERGGDEILLERHPALRDELAGQRHVVEGLEVEVLIVREDEDDVRPRGGFRVEGSRSRGGSRLQDRETAEDEQGDGG